MEQRHLIETATFDLELSGTLDAVQIDGELSRVVQAELLPVVEQVLDELGAGTEPIRLDVLEVDLGRLNFDGSWTQAREQLRQKLRTALLRARRANLPTHAPSAEVRGRRSGDERLDPEAIAVGVQAEQATSHTGQAALLSAAAGGEVLLRGYALYEALRARVLGQSAPAERSSQAPEWRLDVAALVTALLAEHPQQLQRLLRELQGAALTVDWALLSLSGAALRALVSGFVNLTTPVGAGAPSQFMHAIETFAARAGNARAYYAEVLAHLVRDELLDLEAISAAAQAEPRAAAGEGAPLGQAAVAASPPAELQALAMPADAPAALAQYLRDGTMAAGMDSALLQRIAQAMLVDAPERARRMLEASLRDDASLERLLELLPERLLARVLFVLAPPDYAALQGVADTLAIAALGPEAGIAGAQVSRLKWRFVIAYLLHAGARSSMAVFDEAAFVRDFTAELARHSSVADAAALRAALARQLAVNVLSEARELPLRVLQALRAAPVQALTAAGDVAGERPGTLEDSGVVEPGADLAQAADAASADKSLLRGYALYEALRAHLLGHMAPADSGLEPPEPELDVASLVAALLAEHPQQLQRLYRELQGATLPLEPALASLSGAALRALVGGFVSLTTPAEESTPSQFMQAIETFAASAPSARAYYAGVLAHLVRDELLDLEAISAAAQVERSVASGKRTAAVADSLPSAGGEADMSADAPASLAQYLRDGTMTTAAHDARLRRIAQAMLLDSPAQARRLFETALHDEASLERLLTLLPERLLARVVFVLAAPVHAELLSVADTLAIAALGPEAGIAGAQVSGVKWRFVMRKLLHDGAQNSPALFDEAAFVREFTAELARHSSLTDARALREALARQLAVNVLPVARELQVRVLRALRAVAARADQAGTQSRTTATVQDTRDRRADHTLDTAAVAQNLRIDNAGQVLASPYLPLLFGRLSLTENGVFKSRASAERAARLLQFMVDGSTEPAHRPLVLNRILCGLSGPTQPGGDSEPLRAEELHAIESLLQAMIGYWKVSDNTSISGLRESFLQREGVLVGSEDGWRLSVQPRAYDMLLDRLPWSFSMIKHPWMDQLLQVTWR